MLAALHAVDYAAVGLADYGKPGQYIERQVARWTQQYRASETEAIEAMERLIEWLPKHIPADEETSIVHGDFRLDNVIFHPREPRILAVIDWELSTLGHPLVDLAYLGMRYHMSAERVPRARRTRPGAACKFRARRECRGRLLPRAAAARRWRRRIGPTIWRSTCFAWRGFCKGCWRARCKAMLRAPPRWRRAAGRGRWPSWPGALVRAIIRQH